MIMKKILFSLLLAVIAVSMSVVFISCENKGDKSERYEIDQYARIEGLWQDVSKTEGDYVTTEVIYEYKFNYDRTGYWRLYSTLNGKVITEKKTDFNYTFTGDKLNLFYKGVSSPTVYSSHISNNTLTISNEENGTFILKKKIN